jgi:hypothetical protein
LISLTDEIFISYHHNDSRLAGEIKHLLEKKGFTVFLAHEDIDSSVEWGTAIQAHLESCTALMALVTKNFNKSPYTNQEVGIAMGMDKSIIPLAFDRRKLKDLPGFLATKQGVRCSRRWPNRSLNKAIRPFMRRPTIESGLLDRMTFGLAIFAASCLIALSCAVLWLFLGASVIPWGPFIGIVIGAVIISDKLYTGSFDVMKTIDWCKQNVPVILVGAVGFLPASLAFYYSLSLYPTMSGGLKFDTYLTSAPTVAFWAFVALTFGSFMLYHPTTPLRGMRRKTLGWLRSHYKSIRIYAYALFLILIAVAVVPVDTTFVLGTPRVSAVETQEVVATVVNVYGTIIQLRAWTTNQTTLHLLLPPVLLVSQVTYDLHANSTRLPTIATSDGVSALANYDSFGDMTSVAISINKVVPAATIAITYYDDFNISAFAFVPLYTPSRETLKNGTIQVLQMFRMVNRSPYWLNLQSIPIYLGGKGEYPENVTLITTPSQSNWPASTIQNPYGYFRVDWTYGGNMTWLNGYVAPYGNLNMTIVYDQL